MTTTPTTTPMTRTPTPVRPWNTWQDWTNVVLGVYLIFAPIWTAGAPAAWFVPLGVLIGAVGLWALGTISSAGAEWTQIVLGAVTFLAPWLGGFAGAAGAAWTAWIIGVAVIVLAATAMARAKRAAA